MTPLGIAALVLAYIVVGVCLARASEARFLLRHFGRAPDGSPFVVWPLAVLVGGIYLLVKVTDWLLFESWRRKSERKASKL